MDKDEEKIRRFLKRVFGPRDTNPAVIRNPGCEFTLRVLDYLYLEWEIDIVDYPHDIQNKAIDMVERLKGKENVPNIASKISMEVIPI